METYGYVYLTTNKINNKKYIGQHKGHWNKNYYGSGILIKKAIQKYGIENFDHYPLTIAFNKDELNQLEIEFIEYYRPEYNIAKGGYGGCGKLSEEHKRKISESNKRRIYSEKTKQKISVSHKGKHLTEETKKKISAFNRGKIISEEQKKKIIESNKRRIYSEKTKQKLSEANKNKIPWNKGKTNCYSEETKIKMSEARKNISDETRKRMREAGKIKIFSEEHKKNLSEAQKRRWQNTTKL
jgi:hypothetical protein